MYYISLGYLILICWAMYRLLSSYTPRANLLFWVFAFIFVPYIAAIIYLFFSISIFPRTKMVTCGHENSLTQPSDINTLLNAGFKIPDTIKTYELLEDSAYIDSVKEHIANAKNSIYIATFIFTDETAESVLDLLDDANSRGVKVRLIVDGIGSKAANLFNKTTRRLWKTKYVYFYKYKNIISVNKRLHSKIVIIDGVSWIGSHNIWDRVSAKNKGTKFNNLSIKVSGDVVCQIQAFFDNFFGHSIVALRETPIKAKNTNRLASFLYSDKYKTHSQVNSVLYDSLLQAKRKCVIVNPYFAPPTTMIDILNILLLRNVQVEILVPEKLNNVFTPLADLYLSCLVRLGAKVYRSAGTFDHSKFFIIDDNISIIGSYNTDWRSAYLNMESMYKIYADDISKDLLTIYEKKKDKALKWDVPVLPLPRRAIAQIQSAFVSFF